jgi:energy-coupling factor transport system substrate-specific component
MLVTHLLGVLAFMYPFVLPPERTGEAAAHSSDAPILFALFAALLIAVAASEVRAGSMDARAIALLGVLSGINAMLRLPGSLGGASLMFALPILCGYAFGERFGFLLGACSMAASAAVTAGVGPWLPFQMWALGWVGAGAGLLGRLLRRSSGPPALAALAAYGWVAGFTYGALVNLWFWPFQGGRAEISWVPGIGTPEALTRYWRFYLLTSLAWDSARALGNVVIIAALGRPILRLLMRFERRLRATWLPGKSPPLEPRVRSA